MEGLKNRANGSRIIQRQKEFAFDRQKGVAQPDKILVGKLSGVVLGDVIVRRVNKEKRSGPVIALDADAGVQVLNRDALHPPMNLKQHILNRREIQT